MEVNVRIVGVVHARGGSKRIPRKNLKLLNGKPLVSYIIQTALNARCLDRLIVSTDDHEIARVAKDYGAEIPFMRPADLAEDVPSEIVTQHAIRFVEEQDGVPVDIALTFQPTTPLCRSEDVKACVDAITNSDAESVFTATPIHERPEWMFSKDEKGWDRPFLGTVLRGEMGVSQALPLLYIPNGAVYATRREVLFEQNLLIGARTRMVIMPRELSVDIDDPIDFVVAESVEKMLRG